MSNVVLVVVAHSDDEALGCGGTIRKHVSNGDDVQVVFMADGVTSRAQSNDADLARRNAAAKEAQDILGISQVHSFGFPDQKLDMLPLLDVTQKLESVLDEIKPSIVYTHHHGDLNSDHRVVAQALLTACRPLPGSSVKEIYAFEVMSSTEWNSPLLDPFSPSVFVDISDFLGAKMQSLEKYKVEMRDYPHSRSMEHVEYLAKHRGASVGVNAAEAFVALRILN